MPVNSRNEGQAQRWYVPRGTLRNAESSPLGIGGWGLPGGGGIWWNREGDGRSRCCASGRRGVKLARPGAPGAQDENKVVEALPQHSPALLPTLHTGAPELQSQGPGALGCVLQPRLVGGGWCGSPPPQKGAEGGWPQRWRRG